MEEVVVVKKRDPFEYIKYAMWAGVAVIVIIMLLFVYQLFFNRGTYVNLSGTAVVKQLQQLNRYETTSFTIEKIIDAGTTGNAFTNILFGDKLLLIAHGNVIAGFDFSKLKSGSVDVNGTTVTLNLPAPQILVSSLDETQTRVYDRSTGIFTKGDKNLESKARAAAQESIRKAACDEGILAEATKNGRTQLTALLKALGFTTVIINIPAALSC